ncbi:hypothetical protein A5761_24045 [Mycolicibacterium setense]|nr:hypothetical protein A5761_24045 [Mycolicibacterium setense]
MLTLDAAPPSVDAAVLKESSMPPIAVRCVEFDSFFVGTDAVGTMPGSEIDGNVSAAPTSFPSLGNTGSGESPCAPSALGISVDGRAGTFTGGPSLMSRDPILMLWAPPLLLIVTPGAIWVLDEVLPEFFAPAFGLVDGDPPAPAALPPPVAPGADAVGALAPPEDSPVEAEVSELVDGESADAPSVSAAEIPYPVATAATNHAATAMPPYPPTLAAVSAALRDGPRVAGALRASGAGTWLTG